MMQTHLLRVVLVLLVALGIGGYALQGQTQYVGISGGATAAAQTTQTVHLAAIETAIEALQADVAAGSTTEWYLSAGATEDENEYDANSGVLMSISGYNNHASANAFVRCINKTATNAAPGTDAIFYGLMLPFGGGWVHASINATYSVALTCYIVLGEAATDTAEVAANDVGINVVTR